MNPHSHASIPGHAVKTGPIFADKRATVVKRQRSACENVRSGRAARRLRNPGAFRTRYRQNYKTHKA